MQPIFCFVFTAYRRSLPFFFDARGTDYYTFATIRNSDLPVLYLRTED